jgi:hypothetical protein
MAENNINVNIEVNGAEESAEKVVKLRQEATKAGEEVEDANKKIEKSAKEAKKETGFLGEKLDDLKETAKKVKADFVNAVGVFKNFGNQLKAAKTGTDVLKLGLTGIKFALSALGIGLIVAAVAALVNYFKNFETGVKIVTTVTNAFGVALGKISKIIEGIITLDFSKVKEGFTGWTSAIGKSIDATNKLFAAQNKLFNLQKKNIVANQQLSNEIENQAKIVENELESYDNRVAAAKKLEEAETKLIQNARDEAAARREILQAKIANEKNDESRKELELELQQTQADLIKFENDLQLKKGESNKKIAELDKKRSDDEQAEADKRNEIAKAEAAKKLQIQEQYEKSLLDLRQQNELAAITDEKKRAEKQLEFQQQNEIDGIKKSEFNAKQKGDLILATEEKYRLIRKNAEDKALEEDRKRVNELLKERKKAEEDTLQNRLKTLADLEKADLDELDKLKATEEEKAKIRQFYADQRIQLEQDSQEIINNIITDVTEIDDVFEKARQEIAAEEQKALEILRINGATAAQIFQVKQAFFDKTLKLNQEEAEYDKKLKQDTLNANLDATSGALNAIAGLLGENSKVGKALAISSAVIDTYVGANKALAQGGFLGFVGAAAVIATGLANVKKIISTKPGTTGGNGPGPSITQPKIPDASQVFSAANAASPQSLQQTQSLITGQINNQQTPPVKAFVLTGDVTTGQQAEQKIQQLARL